MKYHIKPLDEKHKVLVKTSMGMIIFIPVEVM